MVFHVDFHDVSCPNEGIDIEGESALEVFATWGDTNEKACRWVEMLVDRAAQKLTIRLRVHRNP